MIARLVGVMPQARAMLTIHPDPGATIYTATVLPPSPPQQVSCLIANKFIGIVYIETKPITEEH